MASAQAPLVLAATAAALVCARAATFLRGAGIRAASPEDHEAIVGFTMAMAEETEGVALPRAAVDKGVGFVLAGSGLSSRYWVSQDDRPTPPPALLPPAMPDCVDALRRF